MDCNINKHINENNSSIFDGRMNTADNSVIIGKEDKYHYRIDNDTNDDANLLNQDQLTQRFSQIDSNDVSQPSCNRSSGRLSSIINESPYKMDDRTMHYDEAITGIQDNQEQHANQNKDLAYYINKFLYGDGNNNDNSNDNDIDNTDDKNRNLGIVYYKHQCDYTWIIIIIFIIIIIIVIAMSARRFH